MSASSDHPSDCVTERKSGWRDEEEEGGDPLGDWGAEGVMDVDVMSASVRERETEEKTESFHKMTACFKHKTKEALNRGYHKHFSYVRDSFS